MEEVALRGQQSLLAFSIVNSESIEIHLWRVSCGCSKLIPPSSLSMKGYCTCSVALIPTNPV